MFELPKLKYGTGELAPHIDEKTVEVHYGKHHQWYTDKLNATIKNTDLEQKSIEEILWDLSVIPDEIKTAVINNGGGYYNHNIYWDTICPNGAGISVSFQDIIEKEFGSLEQFKNLFLQAAATHFGSWWTWLVKDKSGTLKIISTQNQDCPLSEGLTPLLWVDVWEHAYYLSYQNKRPEYLENWRSIIDWNAVEKRY